MRHGTYHGMIKHLNGKTALLRKSPLSDGADVRRPVLAQFDDLELKEAYGWHEFKRYEFTVDPEGDTDEMV